MKNYSTYRFPSRELKRETAFNYVKHSPEYPTLIMLHGLGGDMYDWLSKTDIIAYSEEYNFNLICPEGEDSFYINDYTDYISEELLDIAEEELDMHDFAIGGLSMGGYGAMIAGFINPNRFSHILSLSGAMPVYKYERILKEGGITPEDREYRLRIFGPFDQIRGSYKDPEYLIARSRDILPPLYICCGQDDEHLRDTRLFVEALESLPVDFTYVENEGKHNWEYWSRMLKPALDWMKAKSR